MILCHRNVHIRASVGGFLVLDCTRKNNMAKKWYKKWQKTWMKSPKEIQTKKILDEIARL